MGPRNRDSGAVGEFEIREERVGDKPRVVLRGHLEMSGAARLRKELVERVGSASAASIDLSGVETLDSSAAAVLAELWNDRFCAGGEVAFEGAQGSVLSILTLYTDRFARDCLRDPPRRMSILAQLGRAVLGSRATIVVLLEFLGQAWEALGRAVRKPRTINWADVPSLVERHGSDGVPIVLLINFLLGLITAYQAAIQLVKFGADVFIADMVSLSVTRELGPLMAAIVVAGRSGAAMAAELGTMKVSEEIDALRTLGLCPQRFLVFPRIIALVIVMPLLTLLADVIAIFGGLLVAMLQLGIPFQGYVNSVHNALGLGDVFGGLLKAVFFGFLIALIGCERGLATRGGAEGVGRSTTTAVVAILFHLIAADAIFTVLFQQLGI